MPIIDLRTGVRATAGSVGDARRPWRRARPATRRAALGNRWQALQFCPELAELLALALKNLVQPCRGTDPVPSRGPAPGSGRPTRAAADPAVDKPILLHTLRGADQHWVYDPTTGIPTRTPGRREASYWYKTERTGSAQQQLAFMAEENRDNLPLVNALREDVRRWRHSQWKGASETTKTLLRHWWREDRPRRLFFCQLEAAETVIYLREMLAQGRVPQFKLQLSLADHA